LADPDVTAIEGNREQRLSAYRAVRDEIARKRSKDPLFQASAGSA
jgi:hypothetical protein